MHNVNVTLIKRINGAIFTYSQRVFVGSAASETIYDLLYDLCISSLACDNDPFVLNLVLKKDASCSRYS